MLQLDIKSIYLILGMIYFGLVLYMLNYSRIRKVYSGFRWFAFGLVSASIGFLFAGMRNIAPDLVAIILANLFILGSTSLFLKGFYSFAARPAIKYSIFIPLIISSLFLVIFVYIYPDMRLRIVYVSSYIALHFLMYLKLLLIDIRRRHPQVNVLFAFAVFAVFAALVHRGVYYLFSGEIKGYYTGEDTTHALFMLGLLFFTIIVALGMMELNAQELERELDEEQLLLHESESKYRRILERSRQGLMIIQEDPLSIVFSSQQMEEMTGYLKTELFGRTGDHVWDLVFAEDLSLVQSRLKMRENEENPVFEFRLVQKNGEICWVECFSTRFEYMGSMATHLVFIDITERKDALDRLKAAQERYERLSQKLKDHLLVFSRNGDGTMLYASEGIELMGIDSPDAVLGRSWGDLVDWTDESKRRVRKSNLDLVEKKMEVSPMELSFNHPDGTVHHMMVYKYLNDFFSEKSVFVEGVAVDTTEQKRNDEKLEIFKKTIENTQASVLITDAKGNIEYVNDACCMTSGYSLDELIGQNPRILNSGYHPDAFWENMWKTLLKGENWQEDIRNMDKNGHFYWEAAALSPILDQDNRVVKLVAVKDDITDRKELEKLKDDVDQILRHDLKQPLVPITTLPYLLKKKANLDETSLKFVESIENAGQQLARMLNLSMDILKMERNEYQLNPSPVDVLSEINRIKDHTQTTADKKRVSIIYQINGNSYEGHSLMVLAEQRILYSLISNLLTNAVEASPEETQVEVDVEYGNDIDIRILNEGVVPLELRDHFFDKYKTAGKEKGTGLGTYAAKLYAEVMGFHLSVHTNDETCRTELKLGIPSEKRY